MMPRLICGLLLGVFFYGGLSLTVRRLATTRHPFAVTLGSLFVRTAVAVAGFFFLIGGHWQNALWALAGFTAARFLLRWERKRLCT
jgi:F1F0 ATPase subunit 2